LAAFMTVSPTLLHEPPSGEIGWRTAYGAAWIAAAQIGRQIVSLAAIAVLARLLSPQDYGLSGMAMAVVGFVSVFAELGLSAATVQANVLTNEQVSTLFWINVSCGVTLTLLLGAAAPLVARFYGDPRVAGLTATLGLGFSIAGIGAQHAALLARRMQFRRTAVVDSIAFFAASVAAVLAAFAQWGAYALVAQFLTERAACALGYWLASGWRPGPPRRHCGVRAMLRVGGFLSAFNTVNYFARNLDRVLLGRFWGAAAVGLYSRAYMLMMYPITFLSGPLTQVMVPALSRTIGERTRFQGLYVHALRIIAAVNFPLMAGLSVAADEVIALVMGAQWSDAVPVFRILAVCGLIQPIVSPVGWLYMASGRTDRMLVWSLIGTPLIVAGFLAGLHWGAVGVAAGYTCVMMALVGPAAVAFALRTVDLDVRPLVLGLAPLLLPAAATWVLLAAVKAYVLVPLGVGLIARLAALVGVGVAVQAGYHLAARDGLLREAMAAMVCRRGPA
jgi:O-antigen/teichoic acid export membrane protein